MGLGRTSSSWASLLPSYRSTSFRSALTCARGFTPRARGFTPRARGFTPRARRNTPRARRFAPRACRFTPRARRFAPRARRFAPTAPTASAAAGGGESRVAPAADARSSAGRHLHQLQQLPHVGLGRQQALRGRQLRQRSQRRRLLARGSVAPGRHAGHVPPAAGEAPLRGRGGGGGVLRAASLRTAWRGGVRWRRVRRFWGRRRKEGEIVGSCSTGRSRAEAPPRGTCGRSVGPRC